MCEAEQKMTRGEKAEALFLEGYNCAQAVLIAFEDLLPYNRKKLALLGASFGGGMARLREVCGSVSGMFMVAGVLYGYDARCEILGTKGCIYLGNTKENSVTLCRSDMKQSREYINSWKYLFREAYLEEDCDFIRAIKEQTTPKVTAYDGKMAVLTVNAGNLSIKEKRIVEIDGDRLI